MGWETRKRGGHYYTRSHKVGGRVTREYIGTGPDAELIARYDELERERRRFEAERWREERARLDAIERDLAAYCRAVDDLAREDLTAAGYHQHARGEWRRSRMAKAQTPAKSLDELAKGGELAQLQRRIDALMTRAQEGDRKAMSDLRPAMREAWGAQWENNLTSPADVARSKLLEATMGDNLLVREAWERRAKTLQRELEGPAPTSLERILCERIATCWLDAQLADILHASKTAHGARYDLRGGRLLRQACGARPAALSGRDARAGPCAAAASACRSTGEYRPARRATIEHSRASE